MVCQCKFKKSIPIGTLITLWKLRDSDEILEISIVFFGIAKGIIVITNVFFGKKGCCPVGFKERLPYYPITLIPEFFLGIFEYISWDKLCNFM